MNKTELVEIVKNTNILELERRGVRVFDPIHAEGKMIIPLEYEGPSVVLTIDPAVNHTV